MTQRLSILTQYDESGASSRIRIYQFLPLLKKAGFDIVVRPLITRESNKLFTVLSVSRNPFELFKLFGRIAWQTLLKRYRDVIEAWGKDAVIVQKDVLPFGLQTLLSLRQKNIIFEFDDAIWEGHQSAGKVAVVSKFLVFYRRKLLVSMLKRARLVIVDNSYLEEFALRYCRKTLIIAAPIDTELYKVPRTPKPNEKRLGWIGSPGTTYLLEAIFPALEELARRVPFTLVNVGGLPLSSTVFKVENVAWSIEAELRELAHFDLGLMPLDDEPFNRGKLGYKMVQYFSAGVPTLATDVGLNRAAVIPGVNGLLYKVDDSADFAAKAAAILTDTELSQKLSQGARKMAEEIYDVRVLCKKLVDAIHEVQKPNPSSRMPEGLQTEKIGH